MNDENNEQFADLLEQSMSGIIKFEPGQMIQTRIVSISGDCIFLHLDGKREGQLEAAELIDKNGALTVKEGDTIKAFYLSSENGEMLFTTKIKGDKAGKAVLESAFENGIPVEGLVAKEIKGGYEITIGDSRAFCPYSQMGLRRVEDPAQYIGKHLVFKISEYSEHGRNILVSNRSILEAERQAKIDTLKKTLSENMKVKGIIQSLRDFGAFVDIGGIQALLPVSEISRSQVDDIHKVLSAGQEIEAVIISLDWKNERISISMKKLLADPWDQVTTKYKPGSMYNGKIVRITDFGAFVSLEPGLDGLIHISDFESEKRINHPREVVKLGQAIEVQITNIDQGKKRIALKPASKSRENEDYGQYMDNGTDTYNPFGDLLKEKKSKKK